MKENLRQLCLQETATIFDAIQKLNESGKGIVLVCDARLCLIGTVTDADVRKGLAQQIVLDQPITRIACLNASTILLGTSKAVIAEKFKTTMLRAFPVVNKRGVVVDCVFVDQVMSIDSAQRILMIMAGGFGKRMGTLTEKSPKPMLNFQGRPMMQHIIERAVAERFEKIFVSTHYLGSKIKEFFGDGSRFEIDIDYIDETVPLGTGGSFAQIPVDNGPIVITNGDVLSAVGYSKLIDFHQLNEASVTVAVYEHVIQHPFGVVRSENIEFVEIDEKPLWVTNVNAGIYVLDASLKSIIEHNESISMPEIIQRVKNLNRRVVIFPLHEHWVDLGTRDVYEQEM